MIKEALQKEIQNICTELGITRQVVLEHPQELSHGDFATSIALSAAKDLKQNPKELAETLAQKIRELNDSRIESVTTAGPGFINLNLSQEALSALLADVLEKEETYGENNFHAGKNILVEHSSPNLFKPFHIGHLMNNTIGEAMTRIVKNTGAQTMVISYPSDVSLGIAKAVYVMLEDGVEVFKHLSTLQEKLTYLGECYVRGTKAFEEDASVEPHVREIVQKLYKKEAGLELDAYELGAQISLSYFKDITLRLGSTFDEFIFESETGVVGKKLVEENIPNVFVQSEGAIIFDGEARGLHTRVFINKDGNPTYEAKDLGLLSLKFSRFDPELSIFVTDHEQGPYFKVVATAAGEIHKEWQEKTVHLTHGRMQFKGERMSSRLGGIPTALEVLDVVKVEAKEKFTERSIGMDTDSFADMVAIAALKFSILKVAPGKPVNFDPEEALSFEGDSGPYIQYTYVRTRALLEKGDASVIRPQLAKEYITTDLERMLYRFEEVALQAAQEYAPHHIAHYLLLLAQAFNSWYAANKVIDESNKELSAHRLAVTKATGTVLKNGLHLLGIQTPERM